MSGSSAYVLVLYNAPTLPPEDPDALAERGAIDTARQVAEALRAAGYRVRQLGITDDPASVLVAFREEKPEVVFNLFEGIARDGHTEAYAIGLLEWLGVPYTGCPFLATVIAHDKPRAKQLLGVAGLPTPAYMAVDRLPVPACTLRWPVIVKPGREDASVGLDQGSVVQNAKDLAARVELLMTRYGPPVLVEEYVDGREISVSLIERPDLQVLPLAEIMFRPGPGMWPIVTYEAKWSTGSREDLATLPRCPADVEAGLAERLRSMAREAFALFECRDYARVDFRINRQGEPLILEVNPNPDFHPSAGLANALRAGGVSYGQFAVDLVRQAIARGPVNSPAPVSNPGSGSR